MANRKTFSCQSPELDFFGEPLMAFLLRATVKPAKAALDSRGAGCKIAFEWFAVTVTAAKWEILGYVFRQGGG